MRWSALCSAFCCQGSKCTKISIITSATHPPAYSASAKQVVKTACEQLSVVTIVNMCLNVQGYIVELFIGEIHLESKIKENLNCLLKSLSDSRTIQQQFKIIWNARCLYFDNTCPSFRLYNLNHAWLTLKAVRLCSVLFPLSPSLFNGNCKYVNATKYKGKKSRSTWHFRVVKSNTDISFSDLWCFGVF